MDKVGHGILSVVPNDRSVDDTAATAAATTAATTRIIEPFSRQRACLN
ncbi:MAG: hypothetical protein IIT33_06645 [Prevotella sp.]|nr:hypothetical protein [Prevotella sp.]